MASPLVQNWFHFQFVRHNHNPIEFGVTFTRTHLATMENPKTSIVVEYSNSTFSFPSTWEIKKKYEKIKQTLWRVKNTVRSSPIEVPDVFASQTLLPENYAFIMHIGLVPCLRTPHDHFIFLYIRASYVRRNKRRQKGYSLPSIAVDLRTCLCVWWGNREEMRRTSAQNAMNKLSTMYSIPRGIQRYHFLLLLSSHDKNENVNANRQYVSSHAHNSQPRAVWRWKNT